MDNTKTESTALGGCENKKQEAAALVGLLAGMPDTARALALGYARGLADAAHMSQPPQKSA